MRRYLLVLLGLLQLVAPLVHAHSGHHFEQFGVHVHTFEIHNAVNEQKVLVLQTGDYLLDADDAIVSISTGIKTPKDSADEQLPLLYFPPAPFAISLALIGCQINFSPQLPQSTKTFLHSPQSPRAPPRLLF